MMTKDEIKKALIQCADLEYCDDCPYFNWENRSCSDELKLDALDLITEQEKEIERLKAENEELSKVVSSKVYDLVDNTKEIADAREAWEQQAKIDVLNELKRQAEHCDQWNCEVIPKEYIDELIKEIER